MTFCRRIIITNFSNIRYCMMGDCTQNYWQHQVAIECFIQRYRIVDIELIDCHFNE